MLDGQKNAPSSAILTADNPENPWTAPKSASRPPLGGKFEPKKSGGNPPPPPPLFGEFHNLFGNDPSPFKTFVKLFSLLLLMWLATGLYRVQPEENAVILRFGRYTGTTSEAGLHYHLPWPIERALKVNVTFERRIELGYVSQPYTGGREDKPEESMMLTGDANIANIDFVVQWKVADAKQFLFNIRDPEITLKRVAESAMREVIGQNTLQDATVDKREDIAARVKKIMQNIMTTYGSGVMITQVLLQESSVPDPVKASYDDVRSATQEAETMKNQALKYRNQIVPRAQGEAISLIKAAEAYKEQTVSQAKGDAQRFIDIYSAYSRAKDVTRERLYIEAWESILYANNVILMDGAKNGTIPYLNLNELRNKPQDTNALEGAR